MDRAVSTHSHPKAAALLQITREFFNKSFNTQPPEGGCRFIRRSANEGVVSTHSRPKAAAFAVRDVVA